MQIWNHNLSQDRTSPLDHNRTSRRSRLAGPEILAKYKRFVEMGQDATARSRSRGASTGGWNSEENNGQRV